jgi:hypothetical protein
MLLDHTLWEEPLKEVNCLISFQDLLSRWRIRIVFNSFKSLAFVLLGVSYVFIEHEDTAALQLLSADHSTSKEYLQNGILGLSEQTIELIALGYCHGFDHGISLLAVPHEYHVSELLRSVSLLGILTGTALDFLDISWVTIGPTMTARLVISSLGEQEGVQLVVLQEFLAQVIR